MIKTKEMKKEENESLLNFLIERVLFAWARAVLAVRFGAQFRFYGFYFVSEVFFEQKMV